MKQYRLLEPQGTTNRKCGVGISWCSEKNVLEISCRNLNSFAQQLTTDIGECRKCNLPPWGGQVAPSVPLSDVQILGKHRRWSLPTEYGKLHRLFLLTWRRAGAGVKVGILRGNFISCFLIDIGPISKIFRILLDGSMGFVGARLFQNQ